MSSICSVTNYLLSSCYLLINVPMIISAVYVLYRFIQVTNTSTEMIKNKLYCISHYAGLTFVATTIFCLCFSIIAISGPCLGLQSSFTNLASSLCLLFFAIQSFILLFILFNKLNLIFSQTIFKLHTATKLICFTALIIISISILIINSIDTYSGNISIIYSLISFNICLLTLISLYIYKLVGVYKNNDIDKNFYVYQLLMTSITKATLLTSLSIIMISIQIFIILLTDIDICILGIYPNFLLISLQYKAFKNYYTKCCCCIDKLFRLCWFKLLINNQSEDKINMLKSLNANNLLLIIENNDNEHDECSESDHDMEPLPKLHKSLTAFDPFNSIPKIVYETARIIHDYDYDDDE